MANPTTNYGFVLPTSTDLVTDLPADFDVALQGVDTRLKALQPGTTLGDIAYSSATANTNTRLGIGSTGNVLSVVAGVPAWTAPSSGAMTLIKRATFSNVADTGTTFDGMFSATYGSYYIVFEGLGGATSSDDFYLQFRYAGPTTQASAYYQSNLNLDTESATLGYSNNANANQITLNTHLGPYTATDEYSRGNLFVFGCSGASAKPIFNGYMSNDAILTGRATYGMIGTARIYTGFICKASTSNVYGTISVYGLAVA
jgi:hypothetical protein